MEDKIFKVWFCREVGYAFIKAQSEKEAFQLGNRLLDNESLEVWDKYFVDVDGVEISVEMANETEDNDIDEEMEIY